MDLGGFMQGVGNAQGGQSAPGQSAGVQPNQMPNAQNAVGSPRTYDPLSVFFDRLVRGLKALADMCGKGGDTDAQLSLDKMANDLQSQQRARVKAFIAKSKADQAVKELTGAGGSNQGVSY